jgi:hypothetical protein
MHTEPKNLYYKYSDYLKEKYGQKVYKLPINLPVTCPNRVNGSGCRFCSEKGTGFEAMSSSASVTEQLQFTSEKIRRKYKAERFIAYFQNYTNTYMPLDHFRAFIEEAAAFKHVVEIVISTRPDCISKEYLDVLKEVSERYHICVSLELGLQTVNYHTLAAMNRGHSLAEFIDAVLQIRQYKFAVCAHVILNLPGDTIEDAIETSKILSALHVNMVKLHSLYIPKDCPLCNDYLDGKVEICSCEEYIARVAAFLEYLDPSIVLERLFSRIPEEDAVFSNWSTSWWKLQDMLLEYMERTDSSQGCKFNYLGGAALRTMDDTRDYRRESDGLK